MPSLPLTPPFPDFRYLCSMELPLTPHKWTLDCWIQWSILSSHFDLSAASDTTVPSLLLETTWSVDTTLSWFTFCPSVYLWVSMVALSLQQTKCFGAFCPLSLWTFPFLSCCAGCLNPRAGREKASKTMQLAKRGSLLLTRARALCHIQCSGAGQRALSPSCYTNL